MICGGRELRILNSTQFDIVEDKFKEKCLLEIYFYFYFFLFLKIYIP